MVRKIINCLTSTKHEPYIKFQVQKVMINWEYLSTLGNAVLCIHLPATENDMTRTQRDSRQRGGNWGHLERLPLNPDTIIVIKKSPGNKTLSVFALREERTQLEAVKFKHAKENQ